MSTALAPATRRVDTFATAFGIGHGAAAVRTAGEFGVQKFVFVGDAHLGD